MKNRKILPILLIGGLCLGVLAGCKQPAESSSEPPAQLETNQGVVIERETSSPDESYSIYEGDTKAPNQSIALPGYSTVPFKADSFKQTVNFPNPEQNDCYIRMTIKLSDGTVIWVSDLLQPGGAYHEITLTKCLSAGSYDAVLHYECFTMDGTFSKLNGADMEFKIAVQ